MGLLFRNGATWNSTLAQHVYTNDLLLSVDEHHRQTSKLRVRIVVNRVKSAHLGHHTRLFQVLKVLLGLLDREAEVGMVILHAGK